MGSMSRYSAGATAAEEILAKVYGVELTKALDPLDAGDFLVIVRRLGGALLGVSREAEANALKNALEALDVDWPNLSDEGRDAVIRAAKEALGAAPAKVLPAVDQVFEASADDLVGTTRRATARQFRLRIAADTTKLDERIARFVRESQGNFVRDEYGRRQVAFGERAREVVASGLEAGLGRDDIAEALSADLGAAGLGRNVGYWQTIAMAFANRGRTYAQLSAFQDAEVDEYRFEAVMDEVTSKICRFMHGRVFSVKRALERFDDVERLRDPEAIKDVQPWVQVGGDEEGNQVLFYERGGRRHVVAQVHEPEEDAPEDTPRYSRALSEEALEAAGLAAPPLHGRCRSTILLAE